MRWSSKIVRQLRPLLLLVNFWKLLRAKFSMGVEASSFDAACCSVSIYSSGTHLYSHNRKVAGNRVDLYLPKNCVCYVNIDDISRTHGHRTRCETETTDCS